MADHGASSADDVLDAVTRDLEQGKLIGRRNSGSPSMFYLRGSNAEITMKTQLDRDTIAEEAGQRAWSAPDYAPTKADMSPRALQLAFGVVGARASIPEKTAESSVDVIVRKTWAGSRRKRPQTPAAASAQVLAVRNL